ARPNLGAYLLDPIVLAWQALVGLVLTVFARRGNWLPLLTVVSSLLVAALFSSRSFDPLDAGRYLTPAVIALLAASAAFLTGLLPTSGRLPGPRSAVVGLIALGALLTSLASVVGFQDLRPLQQGRPVNNEA